MALAPEHTGRPASRESGLLLAISGLGRRFRSNEVVRSLDLELLPGDRIAFHGPNGSGKTTVLRCVTGTLAPSEGNIFIAGHLAGTIGARNLVGSSLAQERSFYQRLTAHDNLLFYARLRHRSEHAARANVAELEEELEIGAFARQRVNRCSSGMIQQLALARSLLGSPALLVLDEPTRSLDDEAVTRLWAALDRRPRLAVLIATHRLDDVDHCDARVQFPT
jgi:ABC-type multidrug transport system ATPase subunit